MNRRQFLKAAAASATGLATGRCVVLLAGDRGERVVDRAVDPPLDYAGAAPNPNALWGMLIDCEKCIGCHACSVACRREFDVPPGVWKSWVKAAEHNGQEHFLPRLCNHCDDAPCVEACPVQAAYRREDGIVLDRYDRCIGCKACMVACPYDARFVHPITRVVDKCTFCAHRVDAGRPPACVEVCPTRARIFGNLNDPTSEISDLLRSVDAVMLKPELNAQCQVHYVAADERLLDVAHGVPSASPGAREAFEKHRRLIQ